MEYTYDANGNMLTDLNKSLTVQEYNHLNLPQQIEITSGALNEINYLYSAGGVKLKKQTKTDFSVGTTTDYVGNVVYEDGEIAYILTAEGRLLPNGSTYEYQYYLKDHLGNTRILFDENKQVLQEYSYYPFGMEMDAMAFTSPSTLENQYLYNGKELQNDEFPDGSSLNWYDYGARMYDAVIACWHVIDPLAEKFYYVTPYGYVENNPIRYLDSDGRIKKDSKGNVIFTPVGEPFTARHPSGASAKMQGGVIYADDEAKIQAFKNMSDNAGFDTDCHGVTFAEGQVWINNDQVDKILEGDGYEKVDKSETKEGDKVVYRDGEENAEHSVTVDNVDSDNGEITVEGLGGLETETKKENVKDAWSKGAKQTYYRKPEQKNKEIVMPEPEKEEDEMF